MSLRNLACSHPTPTPQTIPAYARPTLFQSQTRTYPKTTENL